MGRIGDKSMYRCNNCFAEYESPFDKCDICGYKDGDAPRELYHLFPGTKLNGRYIVGQVLGFGGFGITYKAWDCKLETIVAIKEYYPSGIVNRVPGQQEVKIYAQKRRQEFDFGKERFLEEARNMAKFNSEPNIVNVFEFFEENNTAYIVMEFLDGITLNQYLHDNEGIVDIKTGIQVADAICNALSKIHALGIIHRDVSPDNIFLCIDGAIKLIDFGAARFSLDENKMMTIILKPGFAPPEQYEKVNQQGPWTDVYALGATLYYIVTGEKPQESTNRKIKDELLYPHQINSEIPEYLSNSIMKAMAVDLHLRFSNVNQFYNALHQNRKVLPVEIERKKRKHKRIYGIAAALTVLIVGFSFSLIKWNEEKEAETLPDSEIMMWYCMSGDNVLDAAEKAAYESIIEDFNSSFANVKIKLEGFEEKEYKKKLLETDHLPNVYEYIGFRTNNKPLSLESVYKSDTVKQCDVLDKAEEYFGNYDYLPLGYNVPIIFMNTTVSTFEDNKISSINDIKPEDTSDAKLAVFDNKSFSEMIGDVNGYYDENSLSTFLKGNTQFIGTDTSNYFTIRDALPAQYRIISCDSKRILCSYSDIWVADDMDAAQNRAVIRLLEFMLNDNAQDIMHIQNISHSLPVNDNVLDVYVSVYDDFEEFFDNRNKFQFESN